MYPEEKAGAESWRGRFNGTQAEDGPRITDNNSTRPTAGRRHGCGFAAGKLGQSILALGGAPAVGLCGAADRPAAGFAREFAKTGLPGAATIGVAAAAFGVIAGGIIAVVMIDLQLSQLAHAAVPMLAILTIQVAALAAVAYWVVFRVMGRDYEAAVMGAGMIGFGLGATSNALATMRVLARRFGPAPRAFLIVPIVGAFLIDFANALLTTTALNFLK